MNLGTPEMIFIFLLALIIFGPKKLPELGRQLGRALTEVKRASNEFRSQLESEIRNIEFEEKRAEERRIESPPSHSALEGVVVHDDSYPENSLQDPAGSASPNGHPLIHKQDY